MFTCLPTSSISVTGSRSKDASNHAPGLGLYYTFTTSLKRVPDYLDQFTLLGEEGRRVIRGRIDGLHAAIEAAPRTLGWKMRSKIGTRSRWYQEVSEKSQQYWSSAGVAPIGDHSAGSSKNQSTVTGTTVFKSCDTPAQPSSSHGRLRAGRRAYSGGISLKA